MTDDEDPKGSSPLGTIGDLHAMDPLPEDRLERLNALRAQAESSNAAVDECPECGLPLEGIDVKLHARGHWGNDPQHPGLSPEARARYAAVVRYGDRGRGRGRR